VPSRRAPDLEVGTVLAGQFEIEGKIGRGAVATVYAARDVELDEAIALKAIPTFGNTEAAKRAVLPEYKAVRSLKSGGEHILHIDRPMVCTHAGMDWVLLPMERAEGSFRDWLEETKTDPGVEKRLEEGLTLLRQACRGVEALHAEGLAHMDLKPENLLLVRDEGSSSEETEWTVKIADFGLARSLRRGEVLNQEVVAEGVGTPYYMAPEQIRAARQKEVGEEADIYSLGVMLFELIDGDRPFDGTAERVREKHRKVDPPSVRTALPGRLEEVAHACLRKEAGDRPSGAGKIREALTLETSEERAAFERAREADTIEAWTDFIEAYPEGWRTPEAEGRLAELKKEKKREEWAAEGERLAEEAESAIEKIEADRALKSPGIEAAEEVIGRLEEHVSGPPPAVEEGTGVYASMNERKASLRARLREKKEAQQERRREKREGLVQKAETAIEEEAFERADRLIEELQAVAEGDSPEADRLSKEKEEARDTYRERRWKKKKKIQRKIEAAETAIEKERLWDAENEIEALKGVAGADHSEVKRLQEERTLKKAKIEREELFEKAEEAIERENLEVAEERLSDLKKHLDDYYSVNRQCLGKAVAV